MCECLWYDDGSAHLCEACAGDLAHYRAECERLTERCEALREALRNARVIRGQAFGQCGECREKPWLLGHPEKHAPGCLCAPEAGPEIDAPGEEKSRG